MDFHQPGKFKKVADISNDDGQKIIVYTRILYHLTFKRNIRVVLLYNHTNNSYCLLFSTDTQLDAMKIYRWYKSRLQIEFLFRDAKQYTGFSHCQSIKKKSLEFHFNTSLTAINLAKAEIIEANNGKPVETFSIMALKRTYENTANVHQFIKIFDLKPERILNHPNYFKMISQWKMAA